MLEVEKSRLDPSVLTIGTLIADFIEFGWIRSRRTIARNLRSLANTYRDFPSDPGPLLRIERAAKSPTRFTRCYALDTLGRLGSLAKRTVWTQADALTSPDPFIREAGACALWRMGEGACEVKNQIINSIKIYTREGVARYGLLSLWNCRMFISVEEIKPLLDFVVDAEDSFASDTAKQILDQIRDSYYRSENGAAYPNRSQEDKSHEAQSLGS
jgi:hypothetical protein